MLKRLITSALPLQHSDTISNSDRSATPSDEPIQLPHHRKALHNWLLPSAQRSDATHSGAPGQQLSSGNPGAATVEPVKATGGRTTLRNLLRWLDRRADVARPVIASVNDHCEPVPLYEQAKQRLPCWASTPGDEITDEDVTELLEFMIEGIPTIRFPPESSLDRFFQYLHQVDRFFDQAEIEKSLRLGQPRFHCKKQLLDAALSSEGNKPFEMIRAYLSSPHFKGKYKMLTDIAKARMEQDVIKHFSIAADDATAVVKRLKRPDLATIRKGDYVLHVCKLFNLENAVTERDWLLLFQKASPEHRRILKSISTHNFSPVGMVHKNIISLLVHQFPIVKNQHDRQQHNTHPASLLLEICTGFVFHPNFENTALTDEKSPHSFVNIAQTLSLKYFDAKEKGKLAEFFDGAFIPEDPCYEATAENLLNYHSENNSELIFHSKPQWSHALGATENITGLIAWMGREKIREYAHAKKLDVSLLGLQEIQVIESSRAFASFLLTRENAICAEIIAEAGANACPRLIRQLVHDDLALGVSMAT